MPPQKRKRAPVLDEEGDSSSDAGGSGSADDAGSAGDTDFCAPDFDSSSLFAGCPPVPPAKVRRSAGGPVWVTPASGDNSMMLACLLVEAFGPGGEAAVQFCAGCAEPLERCARIHRYLITRPSLRRCAGGVHAVIAGLRRFAPGGLPAEVEAALLGELGRPCGVTVVVGRVCRVEASLRTDLEKLHTHPSVMKEKPSRVEWACEDAALPPSEHDVPFWQDIDSWQASKIEQGRDNDAAPSTPTPSPQPENSMENSLVGLASDDDGAASSTSCGPASPAHGTPPPPCGEDALAQLPAAAVVVAACCAVIRADRGVWRFECSEQGVRRVREAARELSVRCWMEWDLAEVLEPEAETEGFGGGGGGGAPQQPLFVPRTPRWTLTAVRSHQEAALNASFPRYSGGPRVRSGVVALPCGAGKTMVGVLASACVRAPSLVLCTSGIAVEQWVAQYGRWADLHSAGGRVARYTGKVKDKVGADTQVVVTTYNMLMPRRRSAEGGVAVAALLKRRWGMVVLDEVHVLPAESCSTVIKSLQARAFLGLTATLVREDNKIETLDHLIGPRLHEAEWGDLVKIGVLARVKCIEVRCAMPREFAGEYLKAGKHSLQEMLSCLNPTKLRATADIVRHHEARGDKTLVFSDSLFVLRQLHMLLNRPSISGATPLRERLQLLSDFQSGIRLNTLLVSRIGDCAIDLPAASVIVQVSSHFGSRRQEAQRLGRILRPKGSLIDPVPFVPQGPRRADQTPNALFYTTVSQDTAEVTYSRRRQEFLEEQV